MSQLRITLDAETHQRLLESALAERRPLPWQAEVVIRRALGLPFPCPTPDDNPDPQLVAALPAETGAHHDR
jgi:hypothetical protein